MANDIQTPEDQTALNDSLDMLSKFEQIPAYNVAESLGFIKAGKAYKEFDKSETVRKA